MFYVCKVKVGSYLMSLHEGKMFHVCNVKVGFIPSVYTNRTNVSCL